MWDTGEDTEQALGNPEATMHSWDFSSEEEERVKLPKQPRLKFLLVSWKDKVIKDLRIVM